MSAKSHISVIFSIYGQFGAISKPDSGRIACESFISINNNLLSYKTELKNLWHSSYTIALSKSIIFDKKY